jgi:hypothetical protein
MARDANAPRLAAAKLLKVQLDAVRRSAGMLVKATRSYKRPGKPEGLRQKDVEKASGLHQSAISQFENNGKVPEEAKLQETLRECGFHLDEKGGKAFLELLTFLRKYGGDIKSIEKEKPEAG